MPWLSTGTVLSIRTSLTTLPTSTRRLDIPCGSLNSPAKISLAARNVAMMKPLLSCVKSPLGWIRLRLSSRTLPSVRDGIPNKFADSLIQFHEKVPCTIWVMSTQSISSSLAMGNPLHSAISTSVSVPEKSPIYPSSRKEI